MKAYEQISHGGATGPLTKGAAGFIMNKATHATFEGYFGNVFELVTTNEPQLFPIGIAGITVSQGKVTLLG